MDDEPKFHDLVSLRRALDARLRSLEHDLKKMTGDIHAQVEQRKTLASRLELGRRLLDMYEQAQGSSSWELVVLDAAESEPASWAPADGAEVSTSKLLRFSQNQHDYILRFSQGSGGFGSQAKGSPQPTFLFFCDHAGRTLLAIDLIEEPTPHGPTYQFTEIVAFVPGNWIKDFLELSEQVSALKRELEIRKKYDPDEINKLKRQFGI